MSTTIENTKNPDVGRTKALQGLLSCLRHQTDDSSSSRNPLSTEQLQELSQKINEILGVDADRDLTPGDQPHQLLNEDGLPIIDISEPVDENLQTSIPLPLVLEQGLTVSPLLSPDEKERRRCERDRILDLLEEEERLEQLREQSNAEEERKEAVRRRKESAKAELERLKAARNLQKKMGRALVRQANEAEDKRQEEGSQSQPLITSLAAKKSVSFADAPAIEGNEMPKSSATHLSDCGDVVPGRLRAQSHIPLVGTTQTRESPMKIRIVERRPIGAPSSLSREADSDDESTSSGQLSSRSDSDSEGFSSSNDDLIDEEPLEEGFDYDTAQHHREIALEYYKKWHTLGAETAKTMAASTLDECEQCVTSSGHLPVSRSRVDRMGAAYDRSHGPVSTSIEQPVIPPPRQTSLRNSVRLGKLENGQLAGGESGESGSEDENMREVIEMLRMGDIRNAGPDFKPSPISTITPLAVSDSLKSSSIKTSNVFHGVKPSRFEPVCGGGKMESIVSQGNDSGGNPSSQPAISSVVERKVPRSVPNQRFPLNKPYPRSAAQRSESAPLMIIDSPSFPVTADTPSHFMTTSFSSPNQTRPEHPPLVKPSATQGSMQQSQVFSQECLSEKPTSRFMAERKK